MKQYTYILGLIAMMSLSLFACDKDDDTIIDPSTEEETFLIQESSFNSSSLISFETITATLEDGTSAECFQITFSANPVESGPFCPTTIDEVAGMGFYDGATNPGLR